MLHRPLGFTTGTRIEVAGLWSDDTHVTLGKADKTWITVPLRIAFARLPATGNAVDFTLVVEPDPAADMRVQFQQGIIDGQLIFNRCAQLRLHFQNISNHYTNSIT